MSPWSQWVIDKDTGELIGPCGCRVPNTSEGKKQAVAHQHEEGTEDAD